MLKYSDFIAKIEEDMATSDIDVVKWVDRNGITRSRKVHRHMVDFKNSKANGAPSQQDAPPK